MDLQFEVAKGIYNCRTCAVIKREDRFLFHAKKGDDFWNLVGGKVKYGESSSEALRRELAEELGVTINNEKLIVIGENFFTLSQKPFHETILVYFVEENHFKGKPFTEKNMKFKWFFLEELLEIKIKPEIITRPMFEQLLNCGEIPLCHIIYKGQSLDIH